MNNVFYIRFVDKNRELSSSNGLPMDILGEMFSKLESLINEKNDSKTFVKEIKSDSYGVALMSSSLSRHNNLRVVHTKINNSEYDLESEGLIDYAKSLNKVFAKYPDTSMEIYPDGIGSTMQQKITKFTFEKNTTFVDYSYLSGVLSEIGSKNLSSKSHIYIDGYPYQIIIDETQEKQLKKFFKGDTISIKIKRRINPKTDNPETTHLDKIYFNESDDFPSSFDSLESDDLGFLDGLNSLNDILGIK